MATVVGNDGSERAAFAVMPTSRMIQRKLHTNGDAKVRGTPPSAGLTFTGIFDSNITESYLESLVVNVVRYRCAATQPRVQASLTT